MHIIAAMDTKPSTKAYAKLDTGSKVSSQEIFETLARRITYFELPPGTRLVEERLSQEFGVSRTPVREALLLLEQAGHIERLTPRGYAVRAIDLASIDKIYTVRIALEELAVTLAAQAIGTLAFQRFKDLAHASADSNMIDPAATSLREGFHEQLAALSDNDTLVRVLRDLDQRIYAVRRLDYRVPERAREAQREHLSILHLLEQHQVDEARRAMRAHIEGSQATVRALLASGITTISLVTSKKRVGV